MKTNRLLVFGVRLMILVCLLSLGGWVWRLRAQTRSLFIVTSPQEGQLYHSGDTIQLVVSSPAGTTLKEVAVIGPLNIWEDRQPPSTISIVIPQDYAGTLKLHVFVLSESNENASIYRTVNIVPSARLQQITIEPATLQLVAPGTSSMFSTLVADQLVVTGMYADGINRDIRLSSQSVFSSDNPLVATVDSTGIVYAVAPGSTRVRVANSGISASTTVEVNIFPLRGDFNGDGDVDHDDVKILAKGINSLATGRGDPRDLNGDGRIDKRDLGILTNLCIRPHCASRLPADDDDDNGEKKDNTER